MSIKEMIFVLVLALMIDLPTFFLSRGCMVKKQCRVWTCKNFHNCEFSKRR